jgi:tRNA threonylcarbamoyl adenosine modification protein YeaZ
VLVLAFDTSSPAVTAAVVEWDETPPTPPPGVRPGDSFGTWDTGPSVLASRTEVATNRHGELLAPMINAVLDEASASPERLSAIGVGLGPGPFTGLRVGIVTAKAMGDALGIPVYGGCSLDVIARDLSGLAWDDDNDEECDYVVMSDARRKQVYWATYTFTNMRIDGPEISAPRDLARRLAGEIRYVGGAGALLYRDVFADFTVIESHPYPSATTLAERALHRWLLREPAGELEPMYLRRPDAQQPGAPKKVTPV